MQRYAWPLTSTASIGNIPLQMSQRTSFGVSTSATPAPCSAGAFRFRGFGAGAGSGSSTTTSATGSSATASGSASSSSTATAAPSAAAGGGSFAFFAFFFGGGAGSGSASATAVVGTTASRGGRPAIFGLSCPATSSSNELRRSLSMMCSSGSHELYFFAHPFHLTRYSDPV